MYPSQTRRIALVTVAAVVLGAAGPWPAAVEAIGPIATPFVQQAAGKPIFDCTGMQTTSTRLKAGLPVQDNWIKSTEAQLKAAEDGVTQSKEALQELAINAAKDLAIRQLSAVADFKTALLNAKGFSDPKRGLWLRKIDQLKELADDIEGATKVRGAGVAGSNLGKLVQTNRATLQDFINGIQESGLSDELGLKAAVFAGPAGVLVVQTFMVARDVGFAAADGVMSAREAAAARDNLAQMRAAAESVRSRAYELDSILSSDCAPKTAAPEDRMQVTPPADPPVQAAPKHGGGVSTKLIVGVLGAGAAVAGGVVAAGAVKDSLDQFSTLSTGTVGTSTSTTTTTTSSAATYRATVTDTCTPGANGDVTAGQIGTPCSKVLGGSCGAAPASFTFTVAGNGTVRNECWLSDANISGGVYTGKLFWSTCDDPAISGSLPGTWNMTCTEGRTRPATHRVTVVVAKQ